MTFELDLLAPGALRRLHLARMVHQNTPHEPRRHAIKLPPTLPIHSALFRQLEIHLMNKCGRLKGVIGPFAPHLAGGQTPQLIVNKGDESRLGLAVSFTQLLQQLSDLSRWGTHLIDLDVRD
jgi:hypothetical protein